LFTRAFLEGLQLNTSYSHTWKCANAIFGVKDDKIYYEFNKSHSNTIIEPLFNFTALLAGDFSDSLLECYIFSESVI
jgi:hypothetical protein